MSAEILLLLKPLEDYFVNEILKIKERVSSGEEIINKKMSDAEKNLQYLKDRIEENTALKDDLQAKFSTRMAEVNDLHKQLSKEIAINEQIKKDLEKNQIELDKAVEEAESIKKLQVELNRKAENKIRECNEKLVAFSLDEQKFKKIDQELRELKDKLETKERFLDKREEDITKRDNDCNDREINIKIREKELTTYSKKIKADK